MLFEMWTVDTIQDEAGIGGFWTDTNNRDVLINPRW